MTKRTGIQAVLLIAIAATIGCDRVTKHVAAAALAGTPTRSFLADTVRLQYTENPGAFLSLGADWPHAARTAVFGIGSGLLLLLMAMMAVRIQWPPPALFGLALCIAGGFSNLVDRIAYGKVIDFMNVGLGPIRTGIFNVADLAIMSGVAVVVVVGYRRNHW